MPSSQERSFFGSLNSIVSLRESTCEDKWQVAITTALPALGKAMYIMLVPSIDEILENYLHPRTKRSTGKRPHPLHAASRAGITGLRRMGSLVPIPDVDDLIAKMLPGSELFAGRRAGTLESWLWTGIDVLDEISWYWMLLDIGDNFVHYWASGIMESRFCTAPADIYYSARYHDTGTLSSVEMGGFQSGIVVDAIKACHRTSGGNLVAEESASGKTTLFAIDTTYTYKRQAGSSRPTIWLTIEVFTSSGTQVIESEHVQVDNNETRQLTLRLEVQGNWGSAKLRLTSQGGFFASDSQADTTALVWTT